MIITWTLIVSKADQQIYFINDDLHDYCFFSGIEPYHTHTVEDDPMKPISVDFSKGIPICGMFVDYK